MRKAVTCEKAFTLIEVIVAMALLTLVFVGFYPIIISTNKVQHVAEENLKAETLAQNAAEEVLHLAQKNTYDKFKRELPNLQKIIDDEPGSLGYRVELLFPNVQDNTPIAEIDKVMRIKVFKNKNPKLVYETEMWLIYAQE